jgi:hypothetical protein
MSRLYHAYYIHKLVCFTWVKHITYPRILLKTSCTEYIWWIPPLSHTHPNDTARHSRYPTHSMSLAIAVLTLISQCAIQDLLPSAVSGLFADELQ